MKQNEFLKQLDEARILAAIRRVESSTTGEIRVCVAAEVAKDVLARARAAFARLGMHQTRDRNGVLVYFAPVSQSFAVVGDTGIHERCGDEFWAQIAVGMSSSLAAGRLMEGLEEAIAAIGDRLAAHFPRMPGDANELPDTLATDE